MIHELWPGGPRFEERKGVFRIGTDSVLLANFANKKQVKKKRRVIDLGCGSGILSVLLAFNDPNMQIDGIEIVQEAAQLASANTKLCGLDDRITIIEGDLRQHRDLLRPGFYDIVISNPPYFATGSGKRTEKENMSASRTEGTCTLDDICRAAKYLTHTGGSLMLVHKPERLTDVFSAVKNAGFEPKRLRFVHHKSNSPPSIVLIESRNGGKPSLVVEAPLILRKDDGCETEEIKQIYRRSTQV